MERFKSTKKNSKSRKKKRGAKPKYALNNQFCPEGMPLDEWQRGLRSQEAEKGKMKVEMVDQEISPGEFSVVSNSHRYKVVYHGMNSVWNFCSCMDFKTSGLGTCKHIEGVKLYLQNKRTRNFPLPAYSSIYLSYQDKREVKLRIGETNHDGIVSLSEHYFKKDGGLRRGAECNLEQFIIKAKELDPEFRIYPDAMEFIVEIRDRANREKTLKRYSDEDIDNLLTVKLYPYQREGVRFAFARGKSIIADEMGLGKTIQAIATAELLRKEGYVDSVLIMCPTSLKYQWKKEIERFTKASAMVVEGDHLARTRAYRSSDATYKIVSYHSIANDLKVYKSMDCDLLIMDEVQRLKNWNTQIAKAARLIHSNYAVVLSGTPLENKLEELYSVMQLVDQFCLGPFYLFREQSIITEGVTGKVVGYKNLNQVGKKVSSVLIRRTKKQVALQMPERTDKILYVEMTEPQREIHDECQAMVAKIVYKWRHTHFISEANRKRLLLMLSKMRMVCDSTFIIDQTTFHQTKIDEAINIIENMIDSGDEKVVVFSQWERMSRLLAMELEKRDIQYEFLHGGVPSLKRRQLMDNFTDNPDSRVFISTDAGSTGLNLQAASILINLDLPWNPAILEQRIARIYRLGQKRNIQVINMVAHDTIEERMLSTLNFKSEMFAGILDAGEDSIFLENSKIDKILTTFSEVIEPENSDNNKCEPKDTKPSDKDDVSEKTSRQVTSEHIEAVENDTNLIAVSPQPLEATEVQDSEVKEGSNQDKPSETNETNIPAHTESRISKSSETSPNEVINQGISLLKGLSDILSDEKKTTELVNSIVKTDPQTGVTAIHIPVSDKTTVSKIFTTLSKLFNA